MHLEISGGDFSWPNLLPPLPSGKLWRQKGDDDDDDVGSGGVGDDDDDKWESRFPVLPPGR